MLWLREGRSPGQIRGVVQIKPLAGWEWVKIRCDDDDDDDDDFNDDCDDDDDDFNDDYDAEYDADADDHHGNDNVVDYDCDDDDDDGDYDSLVKAPSLGVRVFICKSLPW